MKIDERTLGGEAIEFISLQPIYRNHGCVRLIDSDFSIGSVKSYIQLDNFIKYSFFSNLS